VLISAGGQAEIWDDFSKFEFALNGFHSDLPSLLLRKWLPLQLPYMISSKVTLECCSEPVQRRVVPMSDSEQAKSIKILEYRSRIEKAEGYSAIWEIAKDTVKDTLGEHRAAMMLFLDDLPLQLGAYHPLGTNNIVLNRTLVVIVEAATQSKQLVNAFVYSLLVHEYLHALGHVPEAEVRPLVYEISRTCFGEDHTVTVLAKKSPWELLRGVPLSRIEAPKRVTEIVRDFEKTTQRYIV